MLVEGRLEPALAKRAAAQPVRRELGHRARERASVDVGRAEELERARRSAPLGERGAFQHHRARIAARHGDVRRIRARVDPHAAAERPALAGPALHGDDLQLDVQIQRLHEPARELAHRQAVAHGQRPGADKAFPSGTQPRALYAAADRVRTVEDPDRLAMRGGRLQHVA